MGDHLLAAHKRSNSRRPDRLLSTAISADSSEGVPQIIRAYNSSMGEVDGADMQLSFYSNTRKSLKVWKKNGLPHFSTHVAQCICVKQI